MSPASPPPAPPGRTLRYWVGLVMREHRERHGWVRSKIGGPCNMSDTTVTRFEEGEQWGSNVDQLLASYALALELPDARVFYTQALERWRSEGEPPRIEPPTTASDVIAAEAEAGRRRRSSRPAPDASPARKRRTDPAA